MSQPPRVAIVPGPVGTSCLTCKRRHKKCDLRRPVCERCEQGGFECLGYNHNHNKTPLQLSPGPSRLRRILPKQDITNNLPARQPISGPARSEAGSSYHSVEATASPQGNENDITPAPLAPSSHCLNDQFASTTQHLGHVDTRPNSGTLTTRDHQMIFASHSLASRALGPTPSLRSLFKFYTQIPYVPSHLSNSILDCANFEDHMMTYFDRVMERTYFKPAQAQQALIRNSYASKLRASSITRWVMFLSTRMWGSYYQGDTSQNATYVRWINQMEQALQNALTMDLAPSEAQDRLGNWLHVIFLKARVFQDSNTYCLLRNATPTFLQMLFSEPTLWPSNGDLTSVPLASVISSQRHELTYFALVDIIAAMIFGLPQQVEYDTSPACSLEDSVPHERMHCVPPEFQIILAEINACRDGSPNARDWKQIERRLLTWQARPSELDEGLESWMIVAWLAVQESWRHTLLAYLYMAVCGATSDDPRIQSSIRQIFSVIGTVKKQEASDANVPFFVQSLMVRTSIHTSSLARLNVVLQAGICARSEQHRSLARWQLANIPDITLQLMRAVDFVPVLDHLWHGAAAGGRPIKWGDYVQSREAVIPV